MADLFYDKQRQHQPAPETEGPQPGEAQPHRVRAYLVCNNCPHEWPISPLTAPQGKALLPPRPPKGATEAEIEAHQKILAIAAAKAIKEHAFPVDAAGLAALQVAATCPCPRCSMQSK